MASASGIGDGPQATISILAVVSSEEAASEVRHQLDGAEGMTCVIQSHEQVGNLSVLQAMPDVLLFEVNGAVPEQLRDIESLMTSGRGALSLIGIGASTDAAALRRLMKVGAKAVISSPVKKGDVYALCNKVLCERRSMQLEMDGVGNIVCSVMNAKGGCGATTIAVNVAVVLSTVYKAKACLIDFDIGFGACAHMLDLQPVHFITDALEQIYGLDEKSLRSLVSNHACGLDVLAAPPNPLKGNVRIDPDSARRLIEISKKYYDVVIVDLPRTTEEWAIEIVKYSNRNFVVIQNSLSAVRDAKLLHNAFEQLEVNSEVIELINNRAMSKFSSLSMDEVRKLTRHDFIHKIRNDYSSASIASDKGESVYSLSRSSNMTEDIHELARRIWENHYKSRNAKHGFFGKIMGYNSQKNR